MIIIDIKAYRGRNIHSHKKVIEMTIDLEEFDDLPSNEINYFNERILNLLPGLKKHGCSYGYPGGFVKRLINGTYMAHVIEHCALELSCMMDYDVSFGKARNIEGTSKYLVVFEYRNEKAAIEIGKLAFDIVNSLCNNIKPEIKRRINTIKKKSSCFDFGPSTQAIVDAAYERGIPVTRIGSGSLVRLGYAKYQKIIEGTITENTSCIAVDIACDKSITKEVLKDIGIPVPVGYTCKTLDEVLSAIKDIDFPATIKPEKGNQGKGVSVGLLNINEVKEAFKNAKKYCEKVIVEKYVEGKDYRILVINGKVIAVSQRIPAGIIGTGEHTIKEIIDLINKDTRRGNGHEKPLTKIRIDSYTIDLLKKQGYTIDSIPEKGTDIRLKGTSNLSTGGEAIDCTDLIHPINKEIAVRAVSAIGLDIAGVDIKCRDISEPISEGCGAVIEVNASPGIRMHLFPSKGKVRQVQNSILDMLFPPGSKHSVPIVSITGTNGKTSTARMVSHILNAFGLSVGMTSTGGIYINNRLIMKGDTTGPKSAQMILSDKRVEAAVLETARGGILREGLGYDLSDIGVLLNISEDHLGCDGIKTLEDLLYVKSLVIEAVKSNGYAVLNADDPMVCQAAKRVKCRIIYFSKQEDNIIVRKHISEGGIAIYLKDDIIIISTGNGIIKSRNIKDVPSTLNGKLIHNIENVLATISIAYGLNIPLNIIESGIMTFYSDIKSNPGRFNIFTFEDFRIIVDYGHNISGYTHITNAIKTMNATRLVGIIGVPGDRDDKTIFEIGKISGKTFDKIIIKEDINLRGRKEGEVAELLKEGAISSGISKDSIEYIRFEKDAFKESIKTVKENDLIIIFYENLEPILDLIKMIPIIRKGKVAYAKSNGKTNNIYIS